jgi:hypothetical protein
MGQILNNLFVHSGAMERQGEKYPHLPPYPRPFKSPRTPNISLKSAILCQSETPFRLSRWYYGDEMTQ